MNSLISVITRDSRDGKYRLEIKTSSGYEVVETTRIYDLVSREAIKYVSTNGCHLYHDYSTQSSSIISTFYSNYY